MREILITGFPYVRERYFATFRHWPKPNGVSFLLPTEWIAKGGKVVFRPPTDANVATTRAYFHHSHYPLIGGLLKGFMPGFIPHLWHHRREVKLVYSCSEPTLLTTLYQALWSKMLGKKHVCFTWENLPYARKLHGISRFMHIALLRLNLALSDGLICGNQAGADIHRRYTAKPIAVIPMNGLDPDQFHRLEPRTSSLSSRIVYAFVGAIGYRKGIQNILKALPSVIKRVPSAHVIIAGAGEYEQNIDALIGELGLCDRVTRLPWVEQKELVQLLSASDVFLYPSIPHGGWTEQFGYSMAEASLMELPVIATHTGSISDVVRDGETGLLIPPGDTKALEDAMIRLGTDAELRSRLGHSGRAYISGQLSHAIVANKFYDFFHAIMGGANSR